MNRLVLTDEDEAEFAPFQCAIATMQEFKKSNVMLCTFHGIWQSFKKDLYPLLDDNPNGQLLGMLTLFVTNQIRYIHFQRLFIPTTIQFEYIQFHYCQITSGVALQGLHKPSMRL
jgi:hypothetical protein